VKKTKYIIEEQ